MKTKKMLIPFIILSVIISFAVSPIQSQAAIKW